MICRTPVHPCFAFFCFLIFKSSVKWCLLCLFTVTTLITPQVTGLFVLAQQRNGAALIHFSWPRAGSLSDKKNKINWPWNWPNGKKHYFKKKCSVIVLIVVFPLLVQTWTPKKADTFCMCHGVFLKFVTFLLTHTISADWVARGSRPVLHGFMLKHTQVLLFPFFFFTQSLINLVMEQSIFLNQYSIHSR